ncbi:MAG: UDP-N-acetylmuramate--L-alanine ligase [Anaerolineae bacterium]|nr:UDP-N-acetylmuramate--L-alanine ligase [Anaerolineae bacterium]
MNSDHNAPLTTRGLRIHIIGIGGAGMSAIARVLLDSGVIVSGSDQRRNPITDKLAADGATIFEGHAPTNVPANADYVLISSAVKPDNVELLAAQAANLPILKRRDAFPRLLPDKTMIAVAGTHGKTTTTALIAHLLREAGDDPSYIVGGVMLNTGDNARAGRGAAFVVEADEYDYMFLGLNPHIAIITNIEHDHPDMFPTLDVMIDAFRQFIKRLPDDGLLIVCADDANALALAKEHQEAGKPVITYSTLYPSADWLGSIDSSDDTTRTHFGVRYHHADTRLYDQIALSMAGEHNVRNALAALAAVYAYGLPIERFSPAFNTFKGTGRRFELMGTTRAGIEIYSDYGHHPSAIKAVLAAARTRFPDRKLWAVWQPHTFSRSRLLFDEFAHAFGDADHALVTDVFASREVYQEGDPTGDDLASAIWDAGHKDARYAGSLAETADLLRAEAQPREVVIIFSAGDAPEIGRQLLK